MNQVEFSFLITTKNRLTELIKTLDRLSFLLTDNRVEFIICDDGSTDGTSNFITTHYPNIHLINNIKSRGLIYSRNRLLSSTKTPYAITLDDDAHLVSKDILEQINSHFNTHITCAVIAFRIFWGKVLPEKTDHFHTKTRVKGFVGCGHVWRMEAWRSIPNYPDWFIFYGEEDFASYHLFKAGWEVHYVPNILVHHRVDINSRKRDKDYRIRLRRSLRSGWYLYVVFYPLKTIPRRFLYTIWVQLKTKVFKGDVYAFIAILQALGDLVIKFPRLLKMANRLSKKEFVEYSKLANTRVYWELDG